MPSLIEKEAFAYSNTCAAVKKRAKARVAAKASNAVSLSFFMIANGLRLSLRQTLIIIKCYCGNF